MLKVENMAGTLSERKIHSISKARSDIYLNVCIFNGKAENSDQLRWAAKHKFLKYPGYENPDTFGYVLIYIALAMATTECDGLTDICIFRRTPLRHRLVSQGLISIGDTNLNHHCV